MVGVHRQHKKEAIKTIHENPIYIGTWLAKPPDARLLNTLYESIHIPKHAP